LKKVITQKLPTSKPQPTGTMLGHTIVTLYSKTSHTIITDENYKPIKTSTTQ